jgi:hypothetical protein
MKFEQLALVCTWVIDQLRNESLELKKKFCDPFDSLQEVDSNFI